MAILSEADVAPAASASLNLQAACLDDRNARFAVSSTAAGHRHPAKLTLADRTVVILFTVTVRHHGVQRSG
jgi:hypothetical protein